jgi:hypothetical protein
MATWPLRQRAPDGPRNLGRAWPTLGQRHTHPVSDTARICSGSWMRQHAFWQQRRCVAEPQPDILLLLSTHAASPGDPFRPRPHPAGCLPANACATAARALQAQLATSTGDLAVLKLQLEGLSRSYADAEAQQQGHIGSAGSGLESSTQHLHALQAQLQEVAALLEVSQVG